jgi:hypothetical protein
MTVYAPGPGIAMEQHDEAVYVARLPDGPIIVLEGTAALIWHEACSSGPGTIADRVGEQVDRDTGEIADAVARFVEDLLAQGLLHQAA